MGSTPPPPFPQATGFSTSKLGQFGDCGVHLLQHGLHQCSQFLRVRGAVVKLPAWLPLWGERNRGRLRQQTWCVRMSFFRALLLHSLASSYGERLFHLHNSGHSTTTFRDDIRLCLLRMAFTQIRGGTQKALQALRQLPCRPCAVPSISKQFQAGHKQAFQQTGPIAVQHPTSRRGSSQHFEAFLFELAFPPPPREHVLHSPLKTPCSKELDPQIDTKNGAKHVPCAQFRRPCRCACRTSTQDSRRPPPPKRPRCSAAGPPFRFCDLLAAEPSTCCLAAGYGPA